MRKACYIIISILVVLILCDLLKTIILREGLDNPPKNLTDRDKLWKNNADIITTLNSKIAILNKDLDDLENLKYIRENNPELLGTRVNDDSFDISDVTGYFKSGIDDNAAALKKIAEDAKNAIPKEENVNITGV
tara:strand:- start:38 stop:439 length:402 start_codon:yes stop_codon:yes gene_type:complete